MQSGFSVGRIFGIRLSIDWSWLFIFLLVTWNLAAGVFPALHPDWSLGLYWAIGILAALLFFTSVIVHELAHSLVAIARGLPVRRITLFMFGGVSNIEREPPSPVSEFLIAIVGPLASLVLGMVFLALGSLGLDPMAALQDPQGALGDQSPAAALSTWLGSVNILLAIFNLIPGFPLDGGRVLRSILWAFTNNLATATRWASAVGQVIAWTFIIGGIAMAFGLQLPFFGTGLLSGLWLAFIGWFLYQAAMQSYQRVVVEDLLEGVPVRRLMRQDAPTVSPNLSIDDLVDHYLLGTDERAFPVVDQEKLVGIVCVEDVRGLDRAYWKSQTVASIMTPAGDLAMATPREEVSEALGRLTRKDVRQMPVVQDGQLVGMLRRRDILRWIQLQSEAAA